jgi:hypothetical protein
MIEILWGRAPFEQLVEFEDQEAALAICTAVGPASEQEVFFGFAVDAEGVPAVTARAVVRSCHVRAFLHQNQSGVLALATVSMG